MKYWAWEQKKKDINSLSKTLKCMSDNNLEVMFPSIKKVMIILLTTPATTASVNRATSTHCFIKTDCRSTMSDNCFNALVLLYVHLDIKLDYNRIIQMYANNYICRLLVINSLLESLISLIHKERFLWFLYSSMFIILS